MIMTVEEYRRYVTTDEEDQALEAKLSALELLIRAHTNNNFQQRAFRKMADMATGNAIIMHTNHPFKAGDTVQVTKSELNEGLLTITSVGDMTISVKEDTTEEEDVYITKVVYPMDVKMGVVNLMKWEESNRDKVGVQSESISRHSVTYFNMDGENSLMGYPKSLLGFLAPYKRARFGQGVHA